MRMEHPGIRRLATSRLGRITCTCSVSTKYNRAPRSEQLNFSLQPRSIHAPDISIPLHACNPRSLARSPMPHPPTFPYPTAKSAHDPLSHVVASARPQRGCVWRGVKSEEWNACIEDPPRCGKGGWVRLAPARRLAVCAVCDDGVPHHSVKTSGLRGPKSPK